jgi:hypothetical protein
MARKWPFWAYVCRECPNLGDFGRHRCPKMAKICRFWDRTSYRDPHWSWYMLFLSGLGRTYSEGVGAQRFTDAGLCEGQLAHAD